MVLADSPLSHSRTYFLNLLTYFNSNEICTDIGVDTTDLTSGWIYVANQERNSKSYIALESIDRFGESSDGSSRKIENSEIFGGYTSIRCPLHPFLTHSPTHPLTHSLTVTLH